MIEESIVRCGKKVSGLIARAGYCKVRLTGQTTKETAIETVDGLREETQQQTSSQSDGSEVEPRQWLQGICLVVGFAALERLDLDHLGLWIASVWRTKKNTGKPQWPTHLVVRQVQLISFVEVGHGSDKSSRVP
ncbi:hypothetical protein PMIN04_005690 [Paraphaeosphaeria minitans]